MLELDTVYANYSLYEHMQLNYRQELILGFRNNTEVSNRALVDFESGLWAWRDRALKYINDGVELEVVE